MLQLVVILVGFVLSQRDTFKYLKVVTITSIGDMSNQDVLISINTKSLVDINHLYQDCSDIHFYFAGSVLDHFQQDSCDKELTNFWINVNLTTGDNIVTMFYGHNTDVGLPASKDVGFTGSSFVVNGNVDVNCTLVGWENFDVVDDKYIKYAPNQGLAGNQDQPFGRHTHQFVFTTGEATEFTLRKEEAGFPTYALPEHTHDANITLEEEYEVPPLVRGRFCTKVGRIDLFDQTIVFIPPNQTTIPVEWDVLDWNGYYLVGSNSETGTFYEYPGAHNGDVDFKSFKRSELPGAQARDTGIFSKYNEASHYHTIELQFEPVSQDTMPPAIHLKPIQLDTLKIQMFGGLIIPLSEKPPMGWRLWNQDFEGHHIKFADTFGNSGIDIDMYPSPHNHAYKSGSLVWWKMLTPQGDIEERLVSGTPEKNFCYEHHEHEMSVLLESVYLEYAAYGFKLYQINIDPNLGVVIGPETTTCTYGEYVFTDKCYDCEYGSYNDLEVAQPSCKQCDDVYSHSNTTGIKTISSDDCLCLPGYEKEVDCVECQIGESPIIFLTSFEGFYKDDLSISTCTPCPQKKTTAFTGAKDTSACECGNGMYFDGAVCRNCTYGYYKDVFGDGQCIRCGDNANTTHTGSSHIGQCVCNPGFEKTSGCEECSKGFYKETIGNEACSPCINGRVTESIGSKNQTDCVCGLGMYFESTICVDCDYGYYKNIYSDNSCTKCETGKSTKLKASISMSDCECDVGFGYVTSCVECPIGEYKGSIGNVSCSSCQENENTTDIGSSECVCVPGSEFNSPNCELCQVGYFKSTFSSSVSCSKCDVGESTLSIGSKTDEDCLCGIAFEKTTGCTHCEDGKYKDVVSDTTMCLDCSPGFYCPSGDVKNEQFCPMGHFCMGGLKSFCSPGYFNNETTVSEACKDCPVDFYCPTIKMENAIKCDPGYFCPLRTITPELCECSGHGDCVEAKDDCHCWGNYTSHDCGIFYCWGELPSGNLDEICNLNGYCSETDTCDCVDGWYGDRCGTFSCNDILPENSAVCNGNGDCVGLNQCECREEYFSGDYCEVDNRDDNDDSQDDNDDSQDSDSGMVYIVIGSVGGVLLLCMIVLSLFVICFITCLCMFRAKQDKTKNERFELMEVTTEGEAAFKLNKKFMRIDQKDIKLVKSLGVGGFAEVFLCEWENRNVAMKMFNTKNALNKKEDFADFEGELEIISSISHPNLLQFFGCSLRPPKVGVVLEYCSNGDIQDYFQTGNKMSWGEKINVIFGVSSAMQYLHNREIIHRDIKSRNILLTKNLEAKVCDFGLARVIETKGQFTRNVGTRVYMAPEVLTKNQYNEKCDVFSFAIVLWELVHESFEPYKSYTDIEINVEFKVAMEPEFRPKISMDKIKGYEWVGDIMEKCWKHESHERLTFEEIFQIVKKRKTNVGGGDVPLTRK